MSDLPFFGGGTSDGGSGGGGVTSYDALTNKPVINLSGSPVIISSLATGVYNIDGTWAITDGDTPRTTRKDDMFYVLNEDGVCKLTWITAGEIYTYSSQKDGGASSIVEDRIAKESDCKNQTGENTDDLIGSFGDEPSGDYENYVGVF